MESALPNSESPPDPTRTHERPRRGAGQPCDVDLSTLGAAQAGDAAAIERFVLHYQGPVFAFLSRSVGRGPHVEDLAQEVFLRVIRALPQFVKAEAKVSTWIFQIAVRLIQDQRKRPARILVPVPFDLHDRGQDPEASCARRRALSRIEILVEQLPEEQRMALVLLEFHGLTHDEVAHIMNCGVSTVKTRLHRAKQFLRAELKKEQGDLS
jgi:RNA polymerase sigma-70 factor (ECF subfamily)